MNDFVEIASLLASLVHHPRTQIFALFSVCALVPSAGIAWLWVRESLQRRAGRRER